VLGAQQGELLLEKQPSSAALLVTGGAQVAAIVSIDWPSEVFSSIGRGPQETLASPPGIVHHPARSTDR